MNYIYTDNEFATEPTRGLPAQLPAGEYILWQGAPNWWAFANEVYKVMLLAGLLTAIAVARVISGLSNDATLGVALGQAAVVVVCSVVGLAILVGLSWLVEKTTVYTITNRRVVLRIGVAIQKTFNVPFAQLDGAQLKQRRDGTGCISLQLKPGVSIAYALIWPHARPWLLSHTQPSLRGLWQADEVAAVLLDAFGKFHGASAPHEALRVGRDASARALASSGQDQDMGQAASNSLAHSQATDNHDPAREPKSAASDQKPAELIKVAKLPVAMAFGLAFATLVFVGLNQLADPTNQSAAEARIASYEIELEFQPRSGNRFAVMDVTHDVQVTMIEPGTDGLLRGALRGFDRVRTSRGLDLAVPYKLERYENDGTYLSDPLTGQDVRLNSFGPFDSGAVADLMALGT
ncbi:MAG: photosynthetic complex putative assembly protein PuhB [Pseudomonadota bacterium]